MFLAYFNSKRSKFITLVQAATKSFTNFSLESSQAYTSAIARSSELEPKIKSARVPVHLKVSEALWRPSKIRSSSPTVFQVVPKSRRFTKKSFVNVSGLLVKTPWLEQSQFVSKTRIPPTRTVISGIVSVNNCDLSTNNSSKEAC